MTRSPITPRQIEAFRAVMTAGGISKGAERMGLSQPSVSRLIQDFEGVIGLNLFERTGNHVIPNGDAFLLLSEVQRAFLGLDRIAQFAAAIKDGRSGSLRVVALQAFVNSVLPSFAGRYLQQRNDLKLSLDSQPSYLIGEAVASGRADIGYAAGLIARPDLETRALRTHAIAIVPKNHPLSAMRVLRPENLQGERFIGIGQGSLFRSRIDSALGGRVEQTAIEVTSNQTACMLVAEGAGVSIVDPFTASAVSNGGVTIVPFEPEIEFLISSIRSAQRAPSVVCRAFADAFEQELLEVFGVERNRGF